MTDESLIAFWHRCCAALGEPEDTPLPPVEPFGDSPALADELLDLVLDGPKRATASVVAEYECQHLPTPKVGDRWIVPDGAGRPRAVLQSTDVRVGPLSSVDAQFAWDEGEGDRSIDYWIDAHTRAFQRHLPSIGVGFEPELPTVFERFDVVYREDSDAGNSNVDGSGSLGQANGTPP